MDRSIAELNRAFGTNMNWRLLPNNNAPGANVQIWFVFAPETTLRSLATNRSPVLYEFTHPDGIVDSNGVRRWTAGAMRQVFSLPLEGAWVHNNGTRRQGVRMVRANGFVHRNNRSEDTYVNIVIHEVAHALGWFGHSDIRNEVMDRNNLGGSPPRTPTRFLPREANHLRQITGLPNFAT